ncbi:MAG: AraC family transcriptional regulator [Caulobacteraceae bacterium]|nr:AraC family transcriptional regulator [Caulobacteraceae bacterium]
MRKPLSRSASLTGFADLARSLGLDPHRLAAEQELPAASLSDPDLRVPATSVGRLLERAAALANAPDFGLRLAETRRLSNLGAVGLVLREQPTLSKALDVIVAYSWAQSEALSLSLELFGEVAVLRDATNARAPFPQSTLLTLGVIVATIRRLMGQDWRPREVWLTQARPKETEAYRRVFAVEPLFSQEFDGLLIDARDLAREVVGADPVAAERALRYVTLDAGAPAKDLAASVQALIFALLPTGDCTIERVCRHLGLSRRTLHRLLATANAPTFTQLLDETRGDLADRYIEDGRLSLTQIAERLGYNSLSAFSRWRRHRRSKSAVSLVQ